MPPAAAPAPAPVYLTREIRAIEQQAQHLPLMERAGLAAAELARDLAGARGGRVLIVAGPGNNGGDAFVVARHLREWWFKVEVVFCGERSKLSRDAGDALQAWLDCGGVLADVVPRGQKWDLAVDGLFGIGLQRELGGRHAESVERINGAGAPVLALDVPSGLEADTGRVMGCAVRATDTVTFIALKPGLLTLQGPDLCGRIHVAPLGLDAPALTPARGHTIAADCVARALQPRPRNSHKGDYGSVGIIGGDAGMAGAALLAGRAALKLGAGRVYLGMLDPAAAAVDPQQPELMLRAVDRVLKLEHLSCLAIGPGLGQNPEARLWLAAALQAALPLVIDADALNLIGADPSLQARLAERTSPAILTPHPAEAGRLAGTTTSAIQRDRVAAALALAERLRCHVVLKGAGSVCATPGGGWHVNTTGNPGMAAAGMGDVLTGMIAALLAQGAAPEQAMLAGVWLHGAGADALAAAGIGPIGLTASELIGAVRRELNQRLAGAA